MANQPPPSRPWLILGSMRPVATPPAPAAASPAQAQAQPQPPAPRPNFRPTFDLQMECNPRRLIQLDYGKPASPISAMVHPGFHEAGSPPPATDAQPQPQAQPPAPRPIFRPTFGQAFKPSTQPQQPPPPPPPSAATAAPVFRVGNISSVPSYPSEKTTLPSEKIKTPAPPPSPLTMLPAHVKFTPEPIEQKTMLIGKPIPPLKPSNGGLQKDVGDTAKPSFVPDYEKREKTKDMESGDHKGNHKKAHSKDDSMKIITIVGDNKGAIMELSLASKKHDPEGDSNTLIKTNPKTSWGSKLGSDASSSVKEESERMEKIQNKMGTPSSPMNAFMNSNVQAVNNSILFNTSCTSHDPGVRVFFSHGDGQNN